MMDVVEKIMRYCAYQERCTSEVENKLNVLTDNVLERNKIMKMLVDDGFVDDRRYAEIFTKSKIHQQHWGRLKITLALKTKRIATEIINEVLSEIDEDEQIEILERLIKSKKIEEQDIFKRRVKIVRYAMSKGYTRNQIEQVLNKTKYM